MMPDEPLQSDDERVLKVLTARKTAGGRHSPLFNWMMEHFATLAAEFARHGPQWATRVVTMGEVGLVDAAGQKPTQRTAMQTWYRVCKAMGAAKGSRPASGRQQPALVDPFSDADDDTLIAGDGTVLTPKKSR
jgi:hypothetical protein